MLVFVYRFAFDFKNATNSFVSVLVCYRYLYSTGILNGLVLVASQEAKAEGAARRSKKYHLFVSGRTSWTTELFEDLMVARKLCIYQQCI